MANSIRYDFSKKRTYCTSDGYVGKQLEVFINLQSPKEMQELENELRSLLQGETEYCERISEQAILLADRSITTVRLYGIPGAGEPVEGKYRTLFVYRMVCSYNCVENEMGEGGCDNSNDEISGLRLQQKMDLVAAGYHNNTENESGQCSREGLELSTPIRPRKGVKAGDSLFFGSYEQNIENRKDPIEWYVLDVQDNKALLLSRYGLDAQQFNKKDVATWQNCSLRSWLNGEFLNNAFSKEQQEAILLTELDNCAFECNWPDNDDGIPTRDRIFLLSNAEVEGWCSYFENNGKEKLCYPTAYAVAHGAAQSDSFKVDGKGTCWWWLRSPGYCCTPCEHGLSFYACVVAEDGTIFENSVESSGNAVRPAFWLDLNLVKEYEPVLTLISKSKNEVAIGDALFLGQFKQNDLKRADPIEWLVLDVQENKALLISRYALIFGPYDRKNYRVPPTDRTWEKSTARRWLNGEFLQYAFNDEERKAILSTIVGDSWESDGKMPTQDTVFLLSELEAMRGFETDQERMCSPTRIQLMMRFEHDWLAQEPKMYLSCVCPDDSVSIQKLNGKTTCPWWLRSKHQFFECISCDGRHGASRYSDYSEEPFGIRPAVWVNLDSEAFKSDRQANGQGGS